MTIEKYKYCLRHSFKINFVLNKQYFSLSLHLINSMKAFACILSLYLLMLTVVPCNDVPTDSAMQKTEFSQGTTAADQHTDADHCSPFCACSCCVSVISYPAHTLSFTCYFYKEIQLTGYRSAGISDKFSFIWQPPQLS